MRLWKKNWSTRWERRRRYGWGGSGGLSPWDARADVDHESGAHNVRDASRPGRDPGGRDDGMAQRTDPAVSTPERAGRCRDPRRVLEWDEYAPDQRGLGA